MTSYISIRKQYFNENDNIYYGFKWQTGRAFTLIFYALKSNSCKVFEVFNIGYIEKTKNIVICRNARLDVEDHVIIDLKLNDAFVNQLVVSSAKFVLEGKRFKLFMKHTIELENGGVLYNKKHFKIMRKFHRLAKSGLYGMKAPSQIVSTARQEILYQPRSNRVRAMDAYNRGCIDYPFQDKLTKVQLLEIARGIGLLVSTNMRKSEICQVLQSYYTSE